MRTMRATGGLRVDRLMSSPVVALRTSDTVRSAARTLLDHGISGAPVLDHRGRWVGVLTKTDVLRYQREYAGPRHDELKRAAARGEPVGIVAGQEREEDYVLHWMGRAVAAVAPEDSVARAARLMAERRVHRVFVRRGRRLVGVLTAFDLLGALGAGALAAGGRRAGPPRRLAGVLRPGRSPSRA